MARYNPNREAIDALNAKLDRIIELLESAQPAPFQWPQYPTWPNTYPPIEPYTPFMPTTATPYIVTVGDVTGSVRTITADGAIVDSVANPAGGYWLDMQDGRRVWYQVESTPTDSVSAVSMWAPQPASEFTVTTTN